MRSNIRIFIGLREIAGYFKSLKSGFDQLGFQSVFVDLGGQPFDYEIEKNPRWASFINRNAQKLSKYFFVRKRIIPRIFWLTFIQPAISFFIFFTVVFRYDVFIFSSNSTFFFYLELPILKLLGKDIIYVFLGSESRPLYLCGRVMKKDASSLCLLKFLIRIQKTTIKIIEKFSDYIITIQPQALFHEKPFISGLIMGFPSNIKLPADSETISNGEVKEIIRILHAPSDRESKGSDVFMNIVGKMKDKGYNIEYIEITGKKNSEVLSEIQKSDFILDELYSDTPLAGLSTEAAFLGKPSVIGSYYADYICNDINRNYIPPSMFVHPDKVEEAIELLITDSEFRKKLGQRAFEFVTAQWAPVKVAERFEQLFNKQFPRDWLFHPQNLTYFYGAGISISGLKDNISKLTEKKGKKSLCLADKPRLEEQIFDLINMKP